MEKVVWHLIITPLLQTKITDLLLFQNILIKLGKVNILFNVDFV